MQDESARPDGGEPDCAPTDTQFRALASKACEMLNRAFAGDPRAMYFLISSRVPCTDALADDPNVVVDEMPIISPAVFQGGQYWAVGMIGVVVGMFQAMGFPCTIASHWSDEADDEGRRKMLGFSVVEFSHCQPGRPGDRTLADEAKHIAEMLRGGAI